MTLLPEIERELLRAARRPVNDESAGREVGKRRRSTAVVATLLVLAAATAAGIVLAGVRNTRTASIQPNATALRPRRWPAGGPCPVASRAGLISYLHGQAHLPEAVGCVTLGGADLEGDGHPERFLLYGQLGPRRSATSFTLALLLASGHVVTTTVPHEVVNPTVSRVANVNDRPGAEIFILEARRSSRMRVGVYTFDGQRLHRAGALWYGGASGRRYGFSCSQNPPATIFQYTFLLKHRSGGAHRWQRSVTIYHWSGAKIQRRATTTTYYSGTPPQRLTSINCWSPIHR